MGIQKGVQAALKVPDLVFLILKLRLHGVEYGRHLRGNSVYIKNVGTITLGDWVSLRSFRSGSIHRTCLYTHCQDSVIAVGDHSHLSGTVIHCRTTVTIGDYCMFAPGSKIMDNDSHRITIDIQKRRQPPESAPVTIGNNVWVGMNALILKGVTIGDNAIVAAHAVVTKDVPKNTLVAGNPARIIREMTE
ncbi:MAG: acyltransferase [Synechococcales bacterium]|nr:acyltransferase [Synechococcales bacterium]